MSCCILYFMQAKVFLYRTPVIYDIIKENGEIKVSGNFYFKTKEAVRHVTEEVRAYGGSDSDGLFFNIFRVRDKDGTG